MNETLLALFAAHLAADFVLQTSALVRRKRNPLYFLLHVAIVAATAMLALGAAPWALLAVLVGTHAAMDAIKTYGLKDTLGAFLADQAVHLVVIVALAFWFPNAAANGAWGALPEPTRDWFYAGLCLFSGVALATQVGAIVIGKICARMLEELEGNPIIQGLKNGGRDIGLLERLIVMGLIVMGQPMGVGFLLAAKSILRFGDVKDAHQMKATEYIIIGTFLSFGWALAVSYLMLKAVGLWVDPAALALAALR